MAELEYVYEPEELHEKLLLPYAAERLASPFGQDGKALCPFHDDRNNPNLELMAPGDDGVPWFYCRACGAAGDVIEFVRRVNGTNFTTALIAASRLLGEQPDDYVPVEPANDRIVWTVTQEWYDRIASFAQRAGQNVEHGLLSYAYGITSEDDPSDTRQRWDAYLIREWGWGLDEQARVAIPHYDREGKLTAVKIRDRDRSWRCYGSLPNLYGSWRERRFNHVVLTEGESDCVWASVWSPTENFDVLALPSGAGAMRGEWLNHLCEWPQVTICLDSDEAGKPAADRWEEAVRERGNRVHRVRLPDGHDLRSSGIAVPEALGL